MAFQLINDKAIESYQVPEGWQYFIAASNRISDKTISNPMPSGLANRFIGGHYLLKPDSDEWKIWASSHDISPEIIGFLSYMEDGNSKNNKGWLFRQDSGEAFLSPRIWAKGVNYAMKKYARGESARDIIIQGMIGVENGIEFLSYLRNLKDMPNIQEILAGDYSWFKKDREASSNWLFISGLSGAIIKNPAVFDKGVEALMNLSEEYITYFIKVMMESDRDKFRPLLIKNKTLQKNVDRYTELLSDFGGSK